MFKIREDPRVTRVGALLRRWSLDELPQLINVLRGEMSLVGPRPLPQRDYERLEDWHRKRYLVLPGMTGLWQVSGRSELDFDELVRLDFLYLERWSVFLDLSILLKTIPAVFRAAAPGSAVASGQPRNLPRCCATASSSSRWCGASCARSTRARRWGCSGTCQPAGADGRLRAGVQRAAEGGRDIPDYPLFLLVGLIVWVFFSQALLAAAPSLVPERRARAQGPVPARGDPGVGGGGAARHLPGDARACVAPVALVIARLASTRRCCCWCRSWRCCSPSCSACRWRCRCCTRTTATSSRCSRPRCCRGSSSPRSSCRWRAARHRRPRVARATC